MCEHDDRGLRNALHWALIEVAASVDGVSPLEIARVTADGPATPADAEIFLSSVRLTARLRTAWDDRCPTPHLLARSTPRPGDTPERRELAEATEKMLTLHTVGCERCTALLTVLVSDLGASDRLITNLGQPGRDWLGPVRVLSGESPDGVDVTVLDNRLLVRTAATLAGAVVYLIVASSPPEVRHAVLQPKSSRALADFSLPAGSYSLYVDIAVQRRSMIQPVERVDLPGGMAAAGPEISTVERRYLNGVLLTAPDGRTARLRVKTGTGYSGSAIEVRLLADPPGGLWTADGRRLAEGEDVVIESPPRPVMDALRELMLGDTGEVRRVH